MKRRKPICGIYKITSPSGRIYIGQSVDIKKRWITHKHFHTKRICRLYNSFKKYGIENHTFEVQEECSIDMLNECERYWQDHYNVLCQYKGMNCRVTGTNDKSAIISDETKAKITEVMKNRPIKDSTREIWRNQRKGGGNGRARLVINIETGIYYDCVKDAAKTINVTRHTLSNRMNGIQYNNTSFRYVDENSNSILNIPNNIRPNRSGENSYNAILILNTQTGIFYYGVQEAASSIGVGYAVIFKCIHGITKKKKLPFIKV